MYLLAIITILTIQILILFLTKHANLIRIENRRRIERVVGIMLIIENSMLQFDNRNALLMQWPHIAHNSVRALNNHFFRLMSDCKQDVKNIFLYNQYANGAIVIKLNMVVGKCLLEYNFIQQTNLFPLCQYYNGVHKQQKPWFWYDILLWYIPSWAATLILSWFLND